MESPVLVGDVRRQKLKINILLLASGCVLATSCFPFRSHPNLEKQIQKPTPNISLTLSSTANLTPQIKHCRPAGAVCQPGNGSPAGRGGSPGAAVRKEEPIPHQTQRSPHWTKLRNLRGRKGGWSFETDVPVSGLGIVVVGMPSVSALVRVPELGSSSRVQCFVPMARVADAKIGSFLGLKRLKRVCNVWALRNTQM